MRRKKLSIVLEVGAVLPVRAAKKVRLVQFEDGSWVGNDPDSEKKCCRGCVGTIEQVTATVVQPVKPQQQTP